MSLRITRDETGIRIGELPRRPERTAVLEARGALLCWDALAPTTHPAALIWDEERAAEWLWEIYGAAAAAPLGDELAAAEAVSAASAQTAALADWRRAWWPASTVAGVPALDPRIVATEAAVALAAIEHLLDDEDAVDRALADAVGAADVLASSASGRLGADAGALRERLVDLVGDRGAAPAAVPAPVAGEYALAAGGLTAAGPSLPLAAGTAPLDLALLPAGVLDAAADARWRIERRDGETVLRVTADRAPTVLESERHAPLQARFADVEVVLEPDDVAFAGEARVTTALLQLPAERRVLSVTSPGMTAQPDHVVVAGADRDALVAAAAALLADSAAPVSVRHAAARRR